MASLYGECIKSIEQTAELICKETIKLRDSTVGRVRLLEANSEDTKTEDATIRFIPGKFSQEQLQPLFGMLVIGGDHTTSQVLNTTLRKISSFCLTKGLAVQFLQSDYNRHVWVCHPSMVLRLLDETGNDLYTSKLKFIPESITTFGNSREVFMASYTDKMVKKLMPSGKAKNILDTSPMRPTGLTVSKNGGIIICLVDAFDFQVKDQNRRQIVRVELSKTDETTVRSVKFADDQYQLTAPYRVTENVNGDVIVIDAITDTSGNVVAYSEQGNLHFVYSGEDSVPFSPIRLCTDSDGNVLVIDSSSDSIHVLDTDGKLKMKIAASETGIKGMSSISVGKDCFLWIGYLTGEVCLFKWNSF